MMNVRKLSTFSVMMITIGTVGSVRNLAAVAQFGSTLFFYYMLAGVFFFIPAALVVADLASNPRQHAGLYDWVRNAFGPFTGVVAVWFQWMQNIFWYPLILSFVAGSLGVFFAPGLADQPGYFIAVIVGCFWLLTLLNIMGLRVSARFATWCTALGFVLPLVVVLLVGVAWWWGGHTVQTSTMASPFFPTRYDWGTVSMLSAVMLSLMGIEVAAVHSAEVNEPRRVYPRALIASALILLIVLMLGAWVVAMLLPAHQLHPMRGLVSALDVALSYYHLTALLPVLVVAMVMGLLGAVNNWMISSTSGLRYAAQHGHLPAILGRTNRRGAPVVLLLIQAVVVTLLSMAFVLMPNLRMSFWLLTAIVVQQYAVAYLLMFASGIRQRYLPGPSASQRLIRSTGLMWCLGGVGMLSSIIIFLVSFFPPIHAGIDPGRYVTVMFNGFLLFSLPMVLLYFAPRCTHHQCRSE